MNARANQLRRLATPVLLVWLSAFAVSVANACVMHVEVDAMHAAAALHPSDEMAFDSHATPGSPRCERLCTDPAVVVQTAKQQSDALHGMSLAPASAPTLVLQAVLDLPRTQVRNPERWPPSTPIPIPIAFLRLTL